MSITHPAYAKAARYCSYQDRTEREVRTKLRALGITQEAEVARLIHELKAENFLDEARYVASFVRGRLIGKQWGKRKIQLALASKGIQEALISKELAAIEDTDYIQALREVARKKKQSLTGKDARQDRQKLTNYLLQKGYESDLVYQIAQELVGE